MSTSSFGSPLPFFPPHNTFFLPGLLLLSAFCAAQELDQLPDAPVPQLVAQSAEPPAAAPETPSAPNANITVPAGTRLQLLLTHPVDSHTSPRGDQVFAQTTAPVVVGDQVAIPGGTYLQGKVAKLTRNGTRAEMLMQSVALVFPNGYIVRAGGPVNIESEQWTAWNNPQGRDKAAIILAPILGLGLGMGIGAATDKPHTVTVGGALPPVPPGFPPVPTLPPLTMTENTHKGLAIGAIVGGIAGGVAALAFAEHNREFYLEGGSPMSMGLPQSITLAQSQIDDANKKAAAQPIPVPVGRTHPPTVVSSTTDNGTCYIPGSPGTPGTHIPGTPGINGSPGTPDIDIPGTPPTPPTPYPCP
jgi:hypothetical protein